MRGWGGWSDASLGPDVAGIWAALGRHDLARTARAARAMQNGHRWHTRSLRRPRSAARTGRDWRQQPRDELGRWASHETEG